MHVDIHRGAIGKAACVRGSEARSESELMAVVLGTRLPVDDDQNPRQDKMALLSNLHHFPWG